MCVFVILVIDQLATARLSKRVRSSDCDTVSCIHYLSYNNIRYNIQLLKWKCYSSNPTLVKVNFCILIKSIMFTFQSYGACKISSCISMHYFDFLIERSLIGKGLRSKRKSFWKFPFKHCTFFSNYVIMHKRIHIYLRKI